MKPLLTLSLLFTLVFSSGLHASQDPSAGIPISKTGETAHAAFLDWASSLDQELPYPAQLHMEMAASVEIEDGADGMTVEMDMDFDMLLDSASEMRSWGAMEMDMAGSGMDIDMRLDIQLGYGQGGLRFLLDDHGFLQDQLGMEIPHAFQLSTDRAEILSKMYMDFILESMEMHGPEAVAAFEQMNGFAEMMHPATSPRVMITAQGMDIVGWGVLEGKARIQSRLKPGMLEQAMGGQAMPFDMSAFEDMIFEMVVDLDSGEMLHYFMDMDLPVTDLLGDGSDLGMNMKMRFEMGAVPPSADAPTIAMPDASEVMVLDEYFDQLLPMIEMALETQRQQMRAMRGEAESEDDYDF